MAASGLVLKPVVESCPLIIRSAPRGMINPPIVFRKEHIVIFLVTVGSKTVNSMEIFGSDTIASVKMRIRASQGFSTYQQRLVHCGKELRGDTRTLMRDCGISSGELVHLVLRCHDLINVNVKTESGTEYVFKAQRSQQVKYVKQQICDKEVGLEVDEQHLVFRGERVTDDKSILDLGVDEKDDVYFLLQMSTAAKIRSKFHGNDIEISISSPEQEQVFTQGPSQDFTLEPLGYYDDEFLRNHPDSLLQILQLARAGLQAGHSPVLASDGSGGAYFMRDSCCMNVAVFKPVDEEPEALNNPRSPPRSSSTEGLKSGIFVGEGAIREVAAYLLDHPMTGYRSLASRNQPGFAGVPPTMMVCSSHRAYNYATGTRESSKVGSLQKYVHSISNCEDMGPARFPVEEVHKICVLDMRLANTDRNGGNILVCKEGEKSAFSLVPIDHGYCLPAKFEDCTFEWLYWPQAKLPFSESTLKYIAKLDADTDMYILGSHGIVLRPECARVLRVGTMLLKKGASAGLTAFAIGSMMSRPQFDVKSDIEEMLEAAEESVSSAACEDAFITSLAQIMDQYIKKQG